MVNFATGLKEYLEYSGVKKNYVSKVSGIDPSKLNRILNKGQPVKEEDMITIAASLGLNVDYFTNRRFLEDDNIDADECDFELYAGSVTDKQANLIRSLDSIFASASYILGAPERLEKMAVQMVEQMNEGSSWI